MSQFAAYNSGGRESQIDLLMCRRCHLNEVRTCKVIDGEAVAAHNRVLVMERDIQQGKKGTAEQATPMIKWWPLTHILLASHKWDALKTKHNLML